MDEAPVFYYDLGDPLCYLAAERVMSELPVVPEWEPVLARGMGIAPASIDRNAVERRSPQRVRWPKAWPPDPELAALAATYAKQIGRSVAFSLACFRQTFAGGRDPGDEETVLIAAAACEMHPAAVMRAIGLASVRARLEAATERAASAGISMLPAIVVGGQVFEGEDALEQAAGALVRS